jgi:hypothetical protein
MRDRAQLTTGITLQELRVDSKGRIILDRGLESLLRRNSRPFKFANYSIFNDFPNLLGKAILSKAQSPQTLSALK